MIKDQTHALELNYWAMYFINVGLVSMLLENYVKPHYGSEITVW